MSLAPQAFRQASIGIWDYSKFAQDYLKITSVSKGKRPDIWPSTSGGMRHMGLEYF